MYYFKLESYAVSIHAPKISTRLSLVPFSKISSKPLTYFPIYPIFYYECNLQYVHIRQDTMINTVIIDANRQEREKISTRLADRDDIKIIAQGKDGYDALRLVDALKPDIIILNDHLELIEEDEIPPLLKARSPSTAVVIATANISDPQLFRAASNEVSGFIYKETDMDSLPDILTCISQGKCFISPYLAARILNLFSMLKEKGIDFNTLSLNLPQTRRSPRQHIDLKFPSRTRRPASTINGGKKIRTCPPGEDPIDHLSKMELRILTCIGEGCTSDEIAENLDLAIGTVRNYVSSVMHKTGLINRSQMVRYAYHFGLVPLNSHTRLSR